MEKDELLFCGYSEEEFDQLATALRNTEMISCGRPDMFQYYQNELTKHVARFLLKPYARYLEGKDDGKPE
jgi:hypothetical protein